MNRILRIILTMILTVSMLMEMIPVNIVHAEGEGEPVDDSTEVVEAPADEEKAEEPAEPAETGTDNQDSPAGSAEAEKEDKKVDLLEEKKDEEEPVVLNDEDFYGEFTVGDLTVIVSYGPNTVPKGTEVKVSDAPQAAIDAIKTECGEDVDIHAADISFVYNGIEVEPQSPVSVSMSFKGEDDLTGGSFETLHVAEEVDDATGEVVYSVDPVQEAEMTDKTDTL